MAVKLVLKQRSEEGGAQKGQELVLAEEDAITLGRDSACQVVLNQKAVSRSHARISRDGALFFVEDLGSAFGTQVNGKRLPQGEKRLLRNGDVIAIAQFDVEFSRQAELPKSDADDHTSSAVRQVVRGVMKGIQRGDGPVFRIMSGPTEGQKIEIGDATELVIGRDDDADIVLDHELVSRRHVKVRRDWSGTHVEDLGSRNGFKVNGRRTTRKTLKDRDDLEIGGVRLLYLDASEVRESAAPQVDEEVEDTRHSESINPNPSLLANTSQEAAQGPAAEPSDNEETESPPEESEEASAEAETSDDGADDESEEDSPRTPTGETLLAKLGPLGPFLENQNAVLLAGMALVAILFLGVLIAILLGA